MSAIENWHPIKPTSRLEWRVWSAQIVEDSATKGFKCRKFHKYLHHILYIIYIIYIHNMHMEIWPKIVKPWYPSHFMLEVDGISPQVVIEKEEDEGELKREVDSLRKLLETQKGLQHTQDRGRPRMAQGLSMANHMGIMGVPTKWRLLNWIIHVHNIYIHIE